MLLFSEYLRELLEAKKMTVSALARLTGVERTTLSKALTGQRVFPYDALDALIYHLRLTPGEEKRFRYYYDAQFEREGIRRSREIIGKMFEDLANLNFAAPAFEETRLLMNLGQYAGERSVFSGATNVQPLLRMVLTDELSRPDARIELTVPPARAFLTDELLHRYLNGPVTAEITQIIAFDASGMAEDINLHNLECFCRVLPLCLLSRRSYHPYYWQHLPAARHPVHHPAARTGGPAGQNQRLDAAAERRLLPARPGHRRGALRGLPAVGRAVERCHRRRAGQPRAGVCQDTQAATRANRPDAYAGRLQSRPPGLSA